MGREFERPQPCLASPTFEGRRIIYGGRVCPKARAVEPAPVRLGAWAKRGGLSIGSYSTLAPAIPTLMEKRVGIFTTWRQRARIGSERDRRSEPNTYAARRG